MYCTSRVTRVPSRPGRPGERLLSTDIGVLEVGEPIGLSLQLTGSGMT